MCQLPSKIVLKSFHGKYLSVESNQKIKANSEEVLAWEIFDVHEVNAGRMQIGLSVKLGGDGPVRYLGGHTNQRLFAAKKLQGWETWTVECLGENKIALKSYHGWYLGATSTGWLFGANKIGDWEKWTFESAPVDQGIRKKL